MEDLTGKGEVDRRRRSKKSPDKETQGSLDHEVVSRMRDTIDGAMNRKK